MNALARLWSLRRERPVFVAAVAVALLALLTYPLVDWYLRSAGVATPFRHYDFGAYYAAVERWHAGEQLYEPSDDGGYHGTYLYPPVVLLLFEPFRTLPFGRAADAWTLFSLGLLWVGLQLVVRDLGYDLRGWERFGLLALLVGFHPLVLTMKLGQMAAFMTALLSFALVALVGSEDGGRIGGRIGHVLSGALTAVVGMVKLAYAPAGTHLLARRDRLLGAIGAGLAVGVLSLVVFGVDAHLSYLDVLAWGASGRGDPRSPQLWLSPYYKPLYAVAPISLALRIGASLGIATLAVLAAPADADRETFALGVAAVPLLSPITYTYYFVSVLPAVLVLLAGELRRDGRPVVPVVGLLLLHVHSYGLLALVELPTVLPAAAAIQPLVSLLQPGLWGNLLLVGLAAVRVGEAATSPAWLSRPKLVAR